MEGPVFAGVAVVDVPVVVEGPVASREKGDTSRSACFPWLSLPNTDDPMLASASSRAEGIFLVIAGACPNLRSFSLVAVDAPASVATDLAGSFADALSPEPEVTPAPPIAESFVADESVTLVGPPGTDGAGAPVVSFVVATESFAMVETLVLGSVALPVELSADALVVPAGIVLLTALVG